MLQLHTATIMHVQDLPLNLRCKMIITNQVIPPMHPVVYPPPLLLPISQARFTSETILLQTWKTKENTTNCPGGSTTAVVPTEWYSHTSQRSNPKWWSWCHSKLAIYTLPPSWFANPCREVLWTFLWLSWWRETLHTSIGSYNNQLAFWLHALP